MSEKEIFDEAKRRLAKRFYASKFIIFALSLVFFIAGTIAIIFQWSWQSSNNRAFLAIWTVLSFFLIGVIFKGRAKLKRNEIKTITGKVVEFKRDGNADGTVWYLPVVKTPSGKKITIGVDANEDNVKLGHKYRFLTMLGTTVKLDELPVESKEKSST